MRTAVIRWRRRRQGRRRPATSSLGPWVWAYKGSGYPGGGRSYQGLDASCRAPSSWRHGTGRFFNGSGTGPSRGAFPFSSSENRRIVPLSSKWRSSKEEEAKQGETDWKGSCRSVLIVRGGQPSASTITGNHDPFCMQGLVTSDGCRGIVGKRRRPRPINRHAASKAAG